MKTSFLFNWILIALTFFIVSDISIVFGQTRSNPFEIKPRLKLLPTVQDSSTSVSIVSPFEVKDRVASLPAPVIDTVDTNSTTNINRLNVAVNPFEVDHVPIRKSAIVKRTENLKTEIKGTAASNNFLFWFLIFSCALLALVMNTKAKSFSMITRSIFNENLLKLFHRDGSNKISLYLVMLYIIFFVNLSIFIYLYSSNNGGPRGILNYCIILLGVILAYSVKHIGLFIFGLIFKVTKNTQLYSFTILVFNAFIGLSLIPLNFIIAFGPTNIQQITIGISFIFIGILVLIRTFRGLFIVSEFLTYRIFQIFIYLCAFEIAPILILVKTIQNWSYQI